jgi:cytochrome c
MLVAVGTAALGGRAFPTQSDAGASGDSVRGKAVFEKRCTGCHALDANREGPHLRGVFGRKAGSLPGFEFSAPMKASGITWDEASLDKWLSDTDAMIPGNAMGFRVPKVAERADIIAYLREQE